MSVAQSAERHESPEVVKDPWKRRALRGLGALGMVAAGYVGGLFCSSAFPISVRIGQSYRADVALSPDPRQMSTIQIQTSAGEADAKFKSIIPAPGIELRPVLDSPNLDLAMPSAAERDNSVASATEQLALRFGIGAAATEILILTGLGLYGHKRPNKRQSTYAIAAGLASVGLVAGQLCTAYASGEYESVKTTDAIATIVNNSSILSDITSRSKQLEPFINNLLAFSSDIQKGFTGAEKQQPDAVKFLLVSDIHSVNQYNVIKKIIEEQGITAVIDTGDITNFGQPEELKLSGILSGIANLGVPYLFVKGNHDGTSTSDRLILNTLSTIKNVILMQPNNDYSLVTIDGISIAGFNDPRYYGDNNPPYALVEPPAAQMFNEAFANYPVPDIVMTHNPVAAMATEKARSTINGHMHTQGLSDDHIQAGSFTGGGIFGYTASKEDGVNPNPVAAFDILSFDSSCQATSLMRFTFEGVVAGRPAYRSVSRFNGPMVMPRADKGRICGAESGISVETIPAYAGTHTQQ